MIKMRIGFCNTKGNFISDAIVWFQKWIDRRAKWSHVYIVISDDKIFESTFPVVKLSDYQKYKGKMTEWEEWVINSNPEKTKIEFEKFYRDYDETGYSIGGILGFIWVFIVRKLFNREARNPFRDGTVCSELASRFIFRLNDAGIINIANNNIDLDTISPDALQKILERNPKVFKKIVASN